MDVGDYLGTSFGASWRWSKELGEYMRARGLTETVITASNETLGYQLAGGELVPGGLTILALLEHEAVQRLAWVRILVPVWPHERAVSAHWHASGLADSWWNGALSGLRLSEGLSARLEREHPRCGAMARDCLEAAFLAPLPSFQRILLPHVAWLDASRSAGGAAIALHIRSGYADHASFDGPAEGAEATAPQPQPFAASQRRSVHAAQWARLNAAYAPCGPQLQPHGNVSCLTWTEGALRAMSTGGASCAAAASGVVLPLAFHTETGPGGDGALGSLLPCAAYAAASRAPGGADSAWRIFAAGDLPPFFLLANRSEALAGHVGTSEGMLGHVSFSRVCRVRPGAEGGQKDCHSVGADPGGAWSRAWVDWYVLGACDVLLRLGHSTFPDAAGSRRGGGHPLWPQAQLAWGYSVEPSSQERAFRWRLNVLVDEIVNQLEAEGPGARRLT